MGVVPGPGQPHLALMHGRQVKHDRMSLRSVPGRTDAFPGDYAALPPLSHRPDVRTTLPGSLSRSGGDAADASSFLTQPLSSWMYDDVLTSHRCGYLWSVFCKTNTDLQESKERKGSKSVSSQAVKVEAGQLETTGTAAQGALTSLPPLQWKKKWKERKSDVGFNLSFF